MVAVSVVEYAVAASIETDLMCSWQADATDFRSKGAERGKKRGIM